MPILDFQKVFDLPPSDDEQEDKDKIVNQTVIHDEPPELNPEATQENPEITEPVQDLEDSLEKLKDKNDLFLSELGNILLNDDEFEEDGFMDEDVSQILNHELKNFGSKRESSSREFESPNKIE